MACVDSSSVCFSLVIFARSLHTKFLRWCILQILLSTYTNPTTVNIRMCVGLIPLSTFPPIDSTIDYSKCHIPHHSQFAWIWLIIYNFCHQYHLPPSISYQHIYRFKMKLQQLLLLSTFSNMCLLVSARSLRALNSEDDGRDSRIIGGNEATPNFHSFAASLQDGQGHLWR